MEKSLCPFPRYILLRSMICSILTTAGTGLSSKCCKCRKCQAGLEEWSIKREVKSWRVTSVTFLLWPPFSKRYIAAYWSAFHVLFTVGPRQNELKCCKLDTANRQITGISPWLKANEHTLLASPKGRSSSTLWPVYPWLMALPVEAWVCASCWQSVGKSP